MATENSSTDLAEFSAWMKAHKFDIDSTDVDAGADLFRAFKAGAGKAKAACVLDAERLTSLLYVHDDDAIASLFASGALDELSADGRTIHHANLEALGDLLDARGIVYDLNAQEIELLKTQAGTYKLLQQRGIEQIRAEALRKLRAERDPFGAVGI
jgi:hypothetical protein